MADISRADAASIISGQKATDVIDVNTATSVVLSTFPQVPMTKKTLTVPMLASLPTASFVAENPTGANTPAGGQKPTTDVSWTDKSMTVEEIATIVPIHEDVLADADIDIWGAIRPKVTEAFALALDAAILFGTNAPASWTDANIVGKAIAAGNRVQNPTGATGQTDLAEQFNQVFANMEADDFDVTNLFAIKSLKARLRGLRDSAGRPVFVDNYRSDRNTDEVYGYPISYLNRRVAQPTVAEAVAIDRSQFQVGIRQDFTVKFLDQATVGGINLAERDMVAMRFKFRVAFGSFVSPLSVAGGYPAAVLQPKIP